MKIRAEQLEEKLAGKLLPAYLVSGNEPLLVAEAVDAVRRKARAEGFAEREVFFAERSFDWNALRTAGQSLSLFSTRRILELKMPSGKAGVDGSRVLTELIESPPPDTLLLVIADQLDRDALKSSWVAAMEERGGWVQVWPVKIGELPRWIAARMARHGLQPTADAAALLAERVEGNLLAADQEIEKLALLNARGAIDAAAVGEAVANSARYDIFQLSDAALDGDAARALRILAGLRGEGTEPPLVLWALAKDVRALWQGEMRARTGTAATAAPVWPRPSPALERARRRASRLPLNQLLRDCSQIDRMIKGHAAGDPWDALARMATQLAGVGAS
ncbi:MAG TPA: DNA polymerase III subunit delta [Steroidobacteraceae bacterium]|nr:DNA polymerase III subunit delta [Steroidobacteraceae bacterium]